MFKFPMTQIYILANQRDAKQLWQSPSKQMQKSEKNFRLVRDANTWVFGIYSYFEKGCRKKRKSARDNPER